MNLGQLKTGQAFEMAGYEWIALEHDEDRKTTLVITKECIEEMPFDEENSNDFRNSSIRKYLNNDFLDELTDEGISENDIALTDFDLTRYNGEDTYGLCRDKIGLLTIEQYKKHKEVLKLNDWWWLITASSSVPGYVYVVNSVGSLNYNNAYNGYGGVRPALNLKSDILVSTNDNRLMTYTKEELLKELLRREIEL